MRDGRWGLLAVILALSACATSPGVPDAIVQHDVTDTQEPEMDADEPEPEPGCPEGEEMCGDACVDLSSDPMNCGGCSIACTPEGINMVVGCVDATCVSSCADGFWDIDGETGCEYPCTFTSGTEVCNGVDDNCDGNVEEGYPCSVGAETTCTTVCGSLGTGICGVDCAVPGPDDCPLPEELCNGRDDDCDTLIDEGFAPGSCGSCVPDCTGRDCGLDPVCYVSCGDCDPLAGEVCNSSGVCVCVPSCLGRTCGPDPICGTSCGTCGSGEICDVSGHCVSSCTPDCTGRACGNDGCGGSCGTCSSPTPDCDMSGHCVCIPACSGRTCGSDGCTGSCGTCTSPSWCDTSTGRCVCTPDCTGRTCGDDGCGGSCGTCGSGLICDSTYHCSSCLETPCGLVPNCGCPSGQKCSLVTGPARACVTAGTGLKGASCTLDSECAAGLICVELPSDEGRSAGACYPFCDSELDCPGDASVCWEAFTGTTDSICSLGCNLVTSTGCPSGSKCNLYELTGSGTDLTDCTSDSGTGGTGSFCTLESHCGPGHFCSGTPYNECIPYCTLTPFDSCFLGCTEFVDGGTGLPVTIAFDGATYGYCF